ncbi:MAG: aldehyde dehydrogenase [Clostridiaceae bacterium]|nr:aldehyde dehydrogenase [Eubacteriales bacterium]
MNRFQAYINGQFFETEKYAAVYNPANGDVVGEAPVCTVKDVDAAVDAAAQAQKSWRRLTYMQRADYLKKWSAKMSEYKEQLGELLCREQGKTLAQATGEANGAANLIAYHAEWAWRIEGEIVTSDRANQNVWIYKEPIGVVGCIIPWNFPLYIIARKVAPALLTGNTVVIKPSSDTPLTALFIAKIFDEIGMPAGVVNVITGSGALLGKALAAHPKIGMISLTGSTAAGQEVMRNCAESVAKVSLELGGKAPSIVMNDANLDLAVASILMAKTKNAGQVCNTPERVYVQRDAAHAFIEKLVEAMQKVTFGDGMANPTMGALVNRKAVETVHAMVERAVLSGAKLVLGGEIPQGAGAFYPPTLLVECRQDMEIMREEIFGPVLPVMVFDTVEEGLALANDCKYGLTAALYTNTMSTMMKFANEIECGELYVNRSQGEAFNGYHSGWKQTGIGGDDGKHGLAEFLQTRTVYCVYQD